MGEKKEGGEKKQKIATRRGGRWAFTRADFNDFGQVIKTLTSIKHSGALAEEHCNNSSFGKIYRACTTACKKGLYQRKSRLINFRENTPTPILLYGGFRSVPAITTIYTVLSLSAKYTHDERLLSLLLLFRIARYFFRNPIHPEKIKPPSTYCKSNPTNLTYSLILRRVFFRFVLVRPRFCCCCCFGQSYKSLKRIYILF